MTKAATAKRKPKPMTRGEAARVIADKAVDDLHYFVRQAWPILEPDRPFVDNWHIHAVCEHLQAITLGQLCNLLLNVPPGTMKSLLVSVLWVAWEWIRRPAGKWVCASHSLSSGQSPAVRDSMRCRQLVVSEWYQDRWPLTLADDQNTKTLYYNDRGGQRMAVSVGGGTGLHPDRVVIDDPHKVIETESDADRQRVLDWWDGTMSNRGIIQGVRRVCIMQRVHAKDLAGHFLDKGNWTHICLPMRYEAPVSVTIKGETHIEPRMKQTVLGFQDPRQAEGELLWPALYPGDVVESMEADMGIYHSASQLQQRPSPRGGAMFKREWFEILPVSPPCRRLVRYWDKAGTKGGRGAETAGVLVGEYSDPKVLSGPMQTKWIVLDVVHGRWEASERESTIKQTAMTDKATYGYVVIWVEAEGGSDGTASAEGTVANLAGFTCNYEHPTGPKVVRADNLSSQASVGRVKLLYADWNRPFLEEHEMFPVGKLKDIVDATAGALNKLYIESTGAFTSAEGVYTGTRSVDRITDGSRLRREDL